MSRFSLLRLIAPVLLFIGFFFLPWYLLLITALLLIIALSRFYEAVVLAFIFDLLFGLRQAEWFNFQFVATITIWFIIEVVEEIKQIIFVYRRS